MICRGEMKKSCSIIYVVVLLASLWANTGAAGMLPKGVIELSPPKPALPLKLANMDGDVTDLKDHAGHWVMVHFWAGWCGPCRRELPTLDRMASKLVPDTIRLVMVNAAEKEDDVFVFLGGVAPNLDTLMDKDGVVTNAWQPRGLPSTFFVDPRGRVRYVALGGRAWDTKPYMDFIRSLSSR
jgi:thiol-disulfide isomerase/thioredoxin